MSSGDQYDRVERLTRIASQLYGLTCRELKQRISTLHNQRGEGRTSLGSVHRQIRTDLRLSSPEFAVVLEVMAAGVAVPTDSLARYFRYGELTDVHLARLVESEYFGNGQQAADKAFARLQSEVTGVASCVLYAHDVPAFMVDQRLRVDLPGVREMSEYHRQRMSQSAERVSNLLHGSRASGCKSEIRLCLASEALDGIADETRFRIDESISTNAETWDIDLDVVPKARLPHCPGNVSSAVLAMTSRGSVIQLHRHAQAVEFWKPTTATAKRMKEVAFR
jgi:hypothetical protein